MKQIILFRGLPGAGKSTLAESLCKTVYSADMFFEHDGEYNFDPTKLPDAHKWCQGKVEDEMIAETDIIGVANTFTTDWEMEPYFELAEDYGYRISTIIVESRHQSGSIHNVPKETIDKMKARFSIFL